MDKGSSFRARAFSLLLAAAALPALLSGGRAVAQAEKGLCFVQISDTHLEPVPFGAPLPGRVRGEETFRWLRRILARPPAGFFPMRPSFFVVTGDLTEFGFWGRTGELAEKTFSSLGLPWYAVCGNHDETWNPAAAFMRKRHGGRRYSFEREGCRFVVLPSSTIQDPLPTLDGGDLAWLRRDLAAGGKKKPIFLFFHHPPASGEFAQPAQLRLLMDALEGYPVVLLCFGHGHRPLHQRLFGWLDCVEGGTTFRKRGAGDFRGMNVISLRGGNLKAVYRFADPQRGVKVLVEKRVSLPPAVLPPFRLLQPESWKVVKGEVLQVVLLAPGFPVGKGGGPLKLLVDGKERPEKLVSTGKGRFRGRISLEGLPPGGHLLTLEGVRAGGRIRQRSRVFYLDRGPVKALWRRRFEGGIKGAPLVLGKEAVVATLEGEVAALSMEDGRVLWKKKLPAEVVGGAARLEDGFVLGCGDGKIYAFRPNGKLRWTFDAGAPVYAPVPAAEGRLYACDAAGVFHCLEGRTGRKIWEFRRAGYIVESRPALWDGLVLFGAWDGFLYALDRKTGRLRWKVPGPRASLGAARYYAPADCGPVPAGKWCYLCDRGYFLGRYDSKGKPGKWRIEGVSALAASGNGGFLNLRTTGRGMVRIDSGGREVWRANIQLGRIPCPPVEAEGRIFAVSDRGEAFALEARSGEVLGSFRITPGLYVMAPPAPGKAGVCLAAGMDGSVTALLFP